MEHMISKFKYFVNILVFSNSFSKYHTKRSFLPPSEKILAPPLVARSEHGPLHAQLTLGDGILGGSRYLGGAHVIILTPGS